MFHKIMCLKNTKSLGRFDVYLHCREGGCHYLGTFHNLLSKLKFSLMVQNTRCGSQSLGGLPHANGHVKNMWNMKCFN
jgi:hypothetical protein